MTFTTLTFIVFLVVTFTIYWSLRQRVLQNIFLFIVSYIFYGWWNPFYCIFLFASSVVDYLVSIAINRVESEKLRRSLLFVALSYNLGILGFFKYWNFFTDNLRQTFASVGWQLDVITLNVILPVGISFYTFQSISYTVDVYRRHLKPASSFLDYLSYLSFFPQLVAGPIERATHLLPQFLQERTFNPAVAVDGCRQMLWGFFKKMLIADNLAPIVDQAYSNPEIHTGPQLAFATVTFAIQIYCDFSAYSDIAIGTAKLFGFDLMRNFAYPYFSQSMAEFWRRWHISLSTWLKDYLYIPLGGSRVPAFRRGMNVMITFLVSGLWHGASWTYVIWGGIHGAVILMERFWIGEKTLRKADMPGGNHLIPRPRICFNMLITFLLTCVAWIFFRAAGISDALQILGKITTESWNPSAYKAFDSILAASPLASNILLPTVFSFILLEWIHRYQPHPLMVGKWSAPLRWLVYTLLGWFTLFWGTWNTGQFVYFQF